jgi:hypothetical protein
VPQVTTSGSRNILASTSAPATINPPSTVDARATGHGSKVEDTSAMALHPAARVAQLGRRSSSNTITARF